MDSDSFPPVPKPLLDRLEQAFPDRVPRTPYGDTGAPYLAYAQGQQSVLDLLRSHYRQQTENVLDPENVPIQIT